MEIGGVNHPSQLAIDLAQSCLPIDSVSSDILQNFAESPNAAVYHFPFPINDPAEDMVISSPPFRSTFRFASYVQLIAVRGLIPNLTECVKSGERTEI